ncbi:MAG: nucleoside triphosphate pyrophosphohydrolase [Bilophila sp.]
MSDTAALSSADLASTDAATHAALDRLNAVIDRLTAPDGCPWDSTQTPESLTEYLIEECHELVDAIRSGTPAERCEELGDVAFLLLFVGRLMARAGGATLAEALDMETAKMIRRHPHVFADATYANQSEQLKDWDRIKREEKAATDDDTPKGTYSSLPRGLPPLTKAYRIHAKADRVGFTWTEDEEVERQVEAEWLELLDAMASGDETAIEHEFGDHLFSLVELGRRKGIKAAPALNAATERFLERFERMEALARERGQDFVALSLDDKDELWNEVKAASKPQTE